MQVNTLCLHKVVMEVTWSAINLIVDRNFVIIGSSSIFVDVSAGISPHRFSPHHCVFVIYQINNEGGISEGRRNRTGVKI